MKKLLLAFCLVSSGAFGQVTNLPWERCTEFYFTPSQVKMYLNGPVQALIGTSPPIGQQSPNVWTFADFKPWGVPADAKYAFLSGMALISHGRAAEISWIAITFRKPGDSTADPLAYLGQTLEPFIGGGVRSNMAMWVPLANGGAEFLLRFSTPNDYPNYSAVGVNLSLQEWCR